MTKGVNANWRNKPAKKSKTYGLQWNALFRAQPKSQAETQAAEVKRQLTVQRILNIDIFKIVLFIASTT